MPWQGAARSAGLPIRARAFKLARRGADERGVMTLRHPAASG
jgi:hypothetical protein